ncbi:MAG: hypothetical protein V7642_2397 [Burkholderiales bacterium]|jgi:hypothetical protein
MLPDSFFDWWFAPWDYAVNAAPGLPFSGDWLGQRDAYRLWCAQAQVTADLPAGFDPGWLLVAGDSGPELTATARLFAGLIAAREHNQSVLGQLAFPDRKWCVSIAATQPLRGCPDVPFAGDDSIEVRGLFELARRLEQRFPGLWSRVRLLLEPTLVVRVEDLLKVSLAAAENADASSMRAQRCWALCRVRVSNMEINDPAINESGRGGYGTGAAETTTHDMRG